MKKPKRKFKVGDVVVCNKDSILHGWGDILGNDYWLVTKLTHTHARGSLGWLGVQLTSTTTGKTHLEMDGCSNPHVCEEFLELDVFITAVHREKMNAKSKT